MNLETKVGLFVLLSFIISGIGIMKLSDISLENRYTLYMVFDDVQGLREKSLVKIAGVEIGRAEKIELEKGKAKITTRIDNDVAVYANAKAGVKLIGFIGSQFLEIDPGTPEAARLKDGDTIYGARVRSMSDLIEKLSDVLEGKDGKNGVGDNLQATVANLRSITDSLNDAVGRKRSELKDMVDNLHQFSVDIKGMSSDMHEVTSSRKEDIEESLKKLHSILERVDVLLANVP